jgi:hypothetical protein
MTMPRGVGVFCGIVRDKQERMAGFSTFTLSSQKSFVLSHGNVSIASIWVLQQANAVVCLLAKAHKSKGLMAKVGLMLRVLAKVRMWKGSREEAKTLEGRPGIFSTGGQYMIRVWKVELNGVNVLV